MSGDTPRSVIAICCTLICGIDTAPPPGVSSQPLQTPGSSGDSPPTTIGAIV